MMGGLGEMNLLAIAAFEFLQWKLIVFYTQNPKEN